MLGGNDDRVLQSSVVRHHLALLDPKLSILMVAISQTHLRDFKYSNIINLQWYAQATIGNPYIDR